MRGRVGSSPEVVVSVHLKNETEVIIAIVS